MHATRLSETQGADIKCVVREFREEYPRFAVTAAVPVNTPDFSSYIESGFYAGVGTCGSSARVLACAR